MYKIIFISIGVLSLLSCSTQEPKNITISEKHGDTLKINEPNFTWNFNPHTLSKQGDVNIASQIYEGLVKYNSKNLTLAPAISKYWIFSEGGKKYTFYLRTNAYFHKNDCFDNEQKTRKITAQDFAYSFEKLASYSKDNENIPAVMEEIIGAQEYFNATKKVKPKSGIKGIEVVNDSTLNIIIKSPNSLFINSLADLKMVVLAKEAIEKYGSNSFVGSGPFYIEGNAENTKSLILARNENYFFNDNSGNPLPYFDNIIVTFQKSMEKELELFEQSELDIVFNIPSDLIPAFLEKNKGKFKGENPEYSIIKDKSGGLNPSYLIQHFYIKDFYTNRHGFVDYTRVYFEK